MEASSGPVKLGNAEPMASKAELFGAKMVTSPSESTVSTSLALVRAPATPLRPAAIAVLETGSGIVNSVSIICTTPPVKFWSYSPQNKYRSVDSMTRATHSLGDGSI